MARTFSEVMEALRRLAPDFLSDEQLREAPIASLARIIVLKEIEDDDLIDQLWISSASGGWLDAHGKEQGRDRIASESDSTYRQRLDNAPRGVTLAHNRRSAGRRILPDGYRVQAVNVGWNFADDDAFFDAPGDIFAPHDSDPKHVYSICLPVVELVRVSGGHVGIDEEADGGCFADGDSYCNELYGDNNREYIWWAIERLTNGSRLRPAGVANMVIVRDDPQLAHHVHVFSTLV